MNSLKNLIGKRINKIFMPSDERIVFETDQGLLVYCSEGDCCSHSYFVHMDGVKALLGQVVNKIEEVKRPYNENDKHENDFDCIQVYGYTFTTLQGRSTLEMRNSSNGYYSGYIVEGTLGKLKLDKELSDDF